MQLVIDIPLSLMGASSMFDTTMPTAEMIVLRNWLFWRPSFLRLSSADRSM